MLEKSLSYSLQEFREFRREFREEMHDFCQEAESHFRFLFGAILVGDLVLAWLIIRMAGSL